MSKSPSKKQLSLLLPITSQAKTAKFEPIRPGSQEYEEARARLLARANEEHEKKKDA
jgi:hypothetical protein